MIRIKPPGWEKQPGNTCIKISVSSSSLTNTMRSIGACRCPDMSRQLVSVVIPVHNASAYLGEAIESVLQQKTRHDIELIVVDDASSDRSAEIAAAYGTKLTLIRLEKNRGASVARNIGIARARGNFYAFLDADDLWETGKTELQMMIFEQQPETEIVFG